MAIILERVQVRIEAAMQGSRARRVDIAVACVDPGFPVRPSVKVNTALRVTARRIALRVVARDLRSSSPDSDPSGSMPGRNGSKKRPASSQISGGGFETSNAHSIH